MTTDHIKMLCDIGELNSLFKEDNLEDLLNSIVKMIADHLKADVCSIYLYDESSEELVLKATIGLNPSSVNKVKLHPGEGIVGSAYYKMQALCEKCGPDNPCFKRIEGINEENYESYIAAPIIMGSSRIGVIAVQRNKEFCFDERDSLALRATASQLASMLEYIRILLVSQKVSALKEKIVPNDFTKFMFIKGKSASKGWVFSKTAIVGGKRNDDAFLSRIKEKQFTLEDFEKALNETKQQLEMLQKKVEERLSDAASLIFEAHLLILKDKGFIGSIRNHINNGINPAMAVLSLLKKYSELFSKSESPIIREKVQDIEDLSFRILENMDHRDNTSPDISGSIIITKEIYPSDLLRFSAEGIAGIINVSGGVTSHISILARSLQIPMVLTSTPELQSIPADTPLLLDADIGNIYINPTEEVLLQFEKREKARKEIETNALYLNENSRTIDGSRILVMINVNLLSDVIQAGKINIDGVGLYRTEFPFMIRGSFPSEEEQYVIYSKLINDMKGKPVTFRTLDIGGDKVLSYYFGAKEENPFLGMRSVRFSLRHEDIFRQQIRAILRAGASGDLRIMFPMISSLDEFRRCREIVTASMKELETSDYQYCLNPKIGIMVEIPSAVSIIEELAGEADFLSVGTNDLIQYTLAVDRTNETVADLYIPHHPSILRSLKRIALAASKAGISVSVCGDMANSEKYIPFLIGIGIDTLSVDAQYLPAVKKSIAALNKSDAEKLTKRILELGSIAEVERIIINSNNITATKR